MVLQEILALYDLEQRRGAEPHGARLEVSGTIVRHVALHDNRSFINYSQLSAETAEAAICEQVDYFQRIGHSFEWAVCSHDSPPDLRARLAAHGFANDEMETIVVLDLHSMPPTLTEPVRHDVRRVHEVDGLRDVLIVKEAVWGRDDYSGQRLERELRETPEKLSVYVAHLDGAPACAAWLRCDSRHQFASLWGGTTRPEFRRRGLYTALVATRAQEAKSRGARFLTVDARDTSRPILEKLGFRALTTATPMRWKPG